MVQGKKLKQGQGPADDDAGEIDFDWGKKSFYDYQPTEDPGPLNAPKGGVGEGGGSLPGGESGGDPREDLEADERWYVLMIETNHKHYLREVRVKAGQRITYGPLTPGGKFPTCFRVYDGKELLVAITGVAWFYRRDFHIRSYAAPSL